MTIKDALKTLGAELWPLKADQKLEVDGYHPTVIDYAGFEVAQLNTKEKCEAFAIVLNDVRSRVPEEGERKCGTCKHRKVTETPFFPRSIQLFVCGLAAPFVSQKLCEEYDGKECEAWQRQETR